MIVIEKREVHGKIFDYTYSDMGFYIERDGDLYDEAYDPEGSGRVYTETDIPIESDEVTAEDYEEALNSLGVMI